MTLKVSGEAATSLTVFQPQQVVPSAPFPGAQAPSIRYGSAPDAYPNRLEPGTFRTNRLPNLNLIALSSTSEQRGPWSMHGAVRGYQESVVLDNFWGPRKSVLSDH